MGLTNFPNGLTSFGVPVLPDAAHTGNVFFVRSTYGSNGNVGSFESPFATIDYAIGMCTASNDDVIYVKAGHVETIAAAGGITADIAGVSIIGLGNGNARPTISWSAADSSFLITAANVSLKNIITTNTIDEVVSMFAVSAAGVTFDAVDFYQTTGQAIQFLLTTAAADQLTVKNCKHNSTAAANSAQVWIALVGTDHSRILNNTIWATANASANSICISGSTAVIQAEIVGNRIAWLGSSVTNVINLVTTSTGIITDNRVFGGSGVLSSTAIVGDTCWMAENYLSNTAGTASGALCPAIDVTT
jgi:hypothetical protein